MICGQRIIRIVKMISLLKQRSYRQRDFADMFKVNVKTINRDFVIIKNCGFNVVKGLHALYYITGDMPEIEKIKKKEESIRRINQNTFYGEYTHKTAIVKQTKDKKFFYILKDLKNKTEYVSPKFTQHYRAVSDLKLAL